MGSVEVYSTRAGQRHRVLLRKPDRRVRERTGFKPRRATEDHLASITVATARGEYVDSATARSTIGELGAEWLAGQSQLQPSAFHSIESAWRIHVASHWRDRRISEVHFSQIQAWITDLASRKSATIVLSAQGVLAGTLEVAVRDRRFASTPARPAASTFRGSDARPVST